MNKHGKFTWNELMTRDIEAAKRFYAESLGWTYTSWQMPEGGTYWVAKAGDQEIAGLMDMSAADFDGMQPHWFAYVEVDDVDARVANLEQLGGRLMRPVFDVQDVGRIAIVTDPTGAAVGWMTPTSRLPS